MTWPAPAAGIPSRPEPSATDVTPRRRQESLTVTGMTQRAQHAAVPVAAGTGQALIRKGDGS